MRILDDWTPFHEEIARHAPDIITGKPDQDDRISIPDPGMVLGCRYCSCSRFNGFYLHRRFHQPFFSMTYLCEGEAYYACNQTEYIAEAGDLCCTAPGNDWTFMHRTDMPAYREYGLIFVGPLLTETLKLFGFDQNPVVHFNSHARFEHLWQKLRDALRNRTSAAGREANAGTTMELFQMIAERRRAEAVPPDMELVRNYIEQHYAGPLAVSELADLVHTSLPSLNQRFRKVFQTTPYQYLIRLRMSRAAHLLAWEKMTIKEAAGLCGYSTPLHFASEFRRFYGKTPGEYRRAVRNAVPGL